MRVEFWRARSGREQVLLGALAGILAAALWFYALIDPLMRRAQRFEQEVAAEQDLLRKADALQARMATLPAPRPRADTSLLLSANRALQEAGLSAYLEEGSADGETRVRLRLIAAPFPQVSAWLAGMAVQEGIRTVSADIERGSAPGITRVSLVLERSDAG